MISRSHPYWRILSTVEKHPEIRMLSMSYYSYSPQTVADSRTLRQITADDFKNHEYVEKIILETPKNQELAIHSNVSTQNDQKKHLVMVDMSTSSKAHLEKLRRYLDDHFFQSIAWFSSGRSFHGYGESLLSQENWVQFMGLLLLANQPRIEPTVDPRWIGHRLLAGYSALRWTRNTSYYISAPTHIERSPSIKGATMEIGALGKKLRG